MRLKTLTVTVALALASAGASLAAASQWIHLRPNDSVRVPGRIVCSIADDGLACASHGTRYLTIALVTDGNRTTAVVGRNGRVVSRTVVWGR